MRKYSNIHNVPKEQVANDKMHMHIPMRDVKFQYLSKIIFWQHHVLGKWNIRTLEIAISDSDEYVLAYGQLDSVQWDWFDKQLGQDQGCTAGCPVCH